MPSRPLTLARSSYRPDIDGLRAVGAWGVILDHAGVPGCAGGFLSVDIFFVLSGYLITANISSRMAQGKFALLDFYGRRTRRTLPALYLMVFCSLAAACVLLLPGELDQTVRSAISAVLLSSNIFFLAQTGYFDPEASTKPLLHSWSLGVEEQFYLISPAIPFLFNKLSKPARRWVYAGAFVLLFGFCIALQAMAPSAAFYLMPARLWEFLAGSAIAAGVVPAFRSRILAEAAAGGSLAGLVLAMTVFSKPLPHPGFPTLLPVVATALLIHIGKTHSTLIGRLLGSGLPVFMGLISYSLYLWHWPMLVFARYIGLPMTPGTLLGGGIVLVAISFLSWKYVEEPFRAPQSVLFRQSRPILAAGAMLLLAICVAVVALRGLPGRFDPEVARVASYYDYADRREFREGDCFITSKYGSAAFFNAPLCLHKSADRQNILIIGDSHAAHLWIGMKTVFDSANVMQATASGCKPLLASSGEKYCTELMRRVFDEYLPRNPVDVIVLSAGWAHDEAGKVAQTVSYLKSFAKKVVVIGRIPGHTSALPNLLARSMLEHNDRLVTDQQSAYSFQVDELFKRVIPSADYVSLVGGLCPQRVCTVYAAVGVPLQFDKDHLTSEGSTLVARYIQKTGILSAQ